MRRPTINELTRLIENKLEIVIDNLLRSRERDTKNDSAGSMLYFGIALGEYSGAWNVMSKMEAGGLATFSEIKKWVDAAYTEGARPMRLVYQ